MVLTQTYWWAKCKLIRNLRVSNSETHRPPHTIGEKEAQGSTMFVYSFKKYSFLLYFIPFSRSLWETFEKCGKRKGGYPAIPDVDFPQSLLGYALKTELWIVAAWPSRWGQETSSGLALPLNRRVTLEPADHPLLWFPKNSGLTSSFWVCYAFTQVLIKRLGSWQPGRYVLCDPHCILLIFL